MGIMLVGVALIVILCLCDYNCDWDGFGYLAAIVIGFMAFLCGLLLPGNEWYMDESQIIKIGEISNATDYVTCSKSVGFNKDGEVVYLKLEEDSNGNIHWSEEVLKGTVVIEYGDFDEPTLVIYEIGYRANFWTFSSGNKSVMYVFKLPYTERRIYEMEE